MSTTTLLSEDSYNHTAINAIQHQASVTAASLQKMCTGWHSGI